jgi:hypothetical protein
LLLVEAAWEELRLTSVIWTKGDKVNLCRYMGAIYKGRSDLLTWTTRKILYLFSCMQLGYLEGKKTRQLLKQNAAAGVEVLEGNADRPTMQQGDKELSVKAVAENQLHVACLMYADESNREKQYLITTVLDEVATWHGKQNHELRSAESVVPWELKQIGGQLMTCLRGTLAKISETSLYDKMGIETCWSACVDMPVGHPQVKGNDDMCKLLFDFTLSLFHHRLIRTLPYLEGWPKRCVLLTAPEHREEAMAALKDDYENFKMIEAIHDQWAKKIVSRSSFSTRSLQQIVLACEKEGWVNTDRWNEQPITQQLGCGCAEPHPQP